MMEKIIDNPAIGLGDIVQYLDIHSGDIIMVSSDVSRLVFAEYHRIGEIPNLDVLIDSLKDAVGEEGTLIFPTFTWDFCKGLPFDILRSDCKTGTLSNAVLKRLDFKRTKHPLYSFAVWGKDTELLCAYENIESFGPGTPFEYLYEHHAKNLLIDISLTQGYTFTHHCEQIGKAPYRFFKKFTSEYIDNDGVKTQRTYRMYVRKRALNAIEGFDEMEEDFIRRQIEKITIINDIRYAIVDIYSSFQLILDDVVNNRSRKIYKYKGQ